jgi:hypothetical protein
VIRWKYLKIDKEDDMKGVKFFCRICETEIFYRRFRTMTVLEAEKECVCESCEKRRQKIKGELLNLSTDELLTRDRIMREKWASFLRVLRKNIYSGEEGFPPQFPIEDQEEWTLIKEMMRERRGIKP